MKSENSNILLVIKTNSSVCSCVISLTVLRAITGFIKVLR